eukprot:CAMPEP_0114510712 /NCGR_PEP_ID=MMETSP0109-20121206/13957_1 /TAXON_ID=29199 /ORGANISM="Chlorarachnion reptans, Strain CCCM449" /LENGTH=356 /DNA_ID=CAMNT_0001690085 /DNA_START=51 /DNA_END=1122 /DNA_ORIENTATION=+
MSANTSADVEVARAGSAAKRKGDAIGIRNGYGEAASSSGGESDINVSDKSLKSYAVNLFHDEQMEYPHFPRRAIKESPSSRKMPRDKERKLREKFCNFIDDFGTRKLRYPRTTVATAMVFFHRYHARYCLHEHDSEGTAVACLLLAGKAEETYVRMKDLVHKYLTYKNGDETNGKDGLKQNKKFEEMLRTRETQLMETIEFTMWVEHPYKFFFSLLRYLILTQSGPKRTKCIARQGYDLINDSFRTNLCLAYPPKAIAVGILKLLTDYHRIKVPEVCPHIPLWYNAILDKENEDDLRIIENEILTVAVANIAKDIKNHRNAYGSSNGCGRRTDYKEFCTPLPPPEPLQRPPPIGIP